MIDAWDAVDGYDPNAGEQERADRIRVRGYALLCARRVREAHVELDRAVTLMMRARVVAERQLEAIRTELSEAEAIADIIALDDAELFSTVAQMLEEQEP